MLVLNPYPQTPFPGKGAILLGLPPLDQARMLAVSHTKPLHDAVAQMADDLYGGFAPATPFQYLQEVYRQTEINSVVLSVAELIFCSKIPRACCTGYLYSRYYQLLEQYDLTDKGKLLSLSLCGIDDTHDHKYEFKYIYGNT